MMEPSTAWSTSSDTLRRRDRRLSAFSSSAVMLPQLKGMTEIPGVVIGVGLWVGDLVVCGGGEREGWG